jgi:hypothetical protein
MDCQDLRATQYVDNAPFIPLINPLADSLPPAPSFSVPKTQNEFDTIAERLQTSFLVYVGSRLSLSQLKELRQVHESTGVPVIVIDASVMPDILSSFGRAPPFFCNMYKHRVMRFLTCEPTRRNVESFAVSNRQWRGTTLRA